MMANGTIYKITDASDESIWGGNPQVGADGMTDLIRRPTETPTQKPAETEEEADMRRFDEYDKRRRDSDAADTKARHAEYRSKKQEIEDNYPVWKRVMGSIGGALQAVGGDRNPTKGGPGPKDFADLNAEYSDLMGNARDDNKASNSTSREIMKQNIIGRFADRRTNAKNAAAQAALSKRLAAVKAAQGNKPLTSDQYLTQVLQGYAEGGGFGDQNSLMGIHMLLNTIVNAKQQGPAANRDLMGGKPIVPLPPGSEPETPVSTPAPQKKGYLSNILSAIVGNSAEAAPARSQAMPETPEQAQSAGWKLVQKNGKSGYVDPTGQYVIPVQ